MKKLNLIILVLCILLVSWGNAQSENEPENLKCEYLINPIGIDAKIPRFSWQMNLVETGVEQKAWIILVGTDSIQVANGKGNVWESGIINSTVVPAVYKGSALQPTTKYFWNVKIRDGKGKWSKPSEVASFETGFLGNSSLLRGDWIFDTQDDQLKPAPYFRNEFNVQKKIKKARAYIAVGGLYELYLNGEKVGNHRLDPMYTRFDRRTLYVTYDITRNLKEGKNAVGVLLGNGWYNHQSVAVWYFDKAPWRSRPKFCMDLKITYTDGTEEIVSTEQNWKTSLSPVIFNSIYTAEHYDARLEQPGWNMPGFDDSKWNMAKNTGAPSQNIVAQALHPIRDVEEIPVKKMVKFNDYSYVFDFGKNMAGVVKLKVKGLTGSVVRLKHGERLYKDGKVDQTNINVHYRPIDDSDPFQTDIVILSGNEDIFMPRFNYKGFQYVEVTSDKPVQLTEGSLTAYFMHSDVPSVGEIHSSNETLNKTWKAANASYLSNLFGYPTDCPQREKNGWTGDAQINIETGLYNFDAITIYEKWLEDHRDEQQQNGALPAIIPTDGWGYHWGNGPDWTSTIAIIPWNIYLFYGDSRLLETCYDNIKKFVDYTEAMAPTGLIGTGLGDWVPVKSKTSTEFTSSAYFYADAVILAKAAKMFGKKTDAEKYTVLAEKIKKAFNDKYLDRSTGMYGNGFQTELSAALFWGLVPEQYKARVAGHLAKRVVADNLHIDVGLLGTKTILNALSENGYPDLAYKVAAQETFPSWGWWIINGATTFYENWPLDASRDISMNHIMFGEINAWYYKALGGIFPDEQQPGFKNIILRPNFVEGLDHFEASHESPYGRITSAWEKKGNNVNYRVTVPANSKATLYLKGKLVSQAGKVLKGDENGIFRIEIKSGNHSFVIKSTED
jgi:alpha-L-rhamnosidase